MKLIEQYISAYFGIGNHGLSKVAELFHSKIVQKNDFLLKAGQYATNLSFLSEGYLRIYAYSENGEKEITQWISGKGSFITDLSSLMFNTPSRWNIQALTPCTLYSISKENYNRISEFSDKWSELEKLFIAKCFVTLENRVFSQLSMSSEEKYSQLFQQNPDIFNQVPLQYIASMLGMTPETLSRIRKKLSS